MPDFVIQRGKGPVWKFKPIDLAAQVWTGQNLGQLGFVSTVDGVSRVTGSLKTALAILKAINADGMTVDGLNLLPTETPTETLPESPSYVIVNRETNLAVCETFNRNLALGVDPAKFIAVPILAYLNAINAFISAHGGEYSGPIPFLPAPADKGSV